MTLEVDHRWQLEQSGIVTRFSLDVDSEFLQCRKFVQESWTKMALSLTGSNCHLSFPSNMFNPRSMTRSSSSSSPKKPDNGNIDPPRCTCPENWDSLRKKLQRILHEALASTLDSLSKYSNIFRQIASGKSRRFSEDIFASSTSVTASHSSTERNT